MILEGKYEKYSSFESNSGYSYFYILPYGKEESILAKSIMAGFRPGMDIHLEGGYEDDTQRGHVFVVSHIKMKFNDEASAVYVLSRGISGISTKIASKVVEEFGTDLIEYLKIDNFRERALQITGIGKTKAEAILSFLKTYTFNNDAYEALLNMGMTYPQAVMIIRDYGPNNLQTIIENIYDFVERYDVPFPVADSIALRHWADIWDRKRSFAIERKVMSNIESSGSTRFPFYAFIKKCADYSRYNHGIQNGISEEEYFVPEVLFHVRSQIDPKLDIYQEGDNYYIAFKQTNSQEEIIAERIKSLCRYRKPLVASDLLDELITTAEYSNKIKYNQMQTEALKLLAYGGIVIITGGPGTGKTTLIKGMINMYLQMEKHKPSDILLCATTGKAAARLGESTGMPATTVHAALGITPTEKTYTAIDRISQPLTIIDEMSMCDTQLLSEIMKRMDSGNMLVIIGDRDQLPSVGAGKIFSTLCDCGVFPVVKLTETVRQKEGSGIIENARRILEGMPLAESDDVKIDIVSPDEISEFVKKNITEDDVQILCPVKEGPAGTKEINEFMQQKHITGQPYIKIKDKSFYEGDRVIMTKNEFDQGYCNGMQGYIRRIANGELEIELETRKITIDASNADNMELSYAVTIHKFQGSENKKILIVLPPKSMTLATRKMLYTAITRAKESVHIIADRNVLDACITNRKEALRICGLLSKITGY